MKRLLAGIFLALDVIVLVGTTGGYFWLKSIIALAVEQAAGQAMGLEVTVTEISLQSFGGTMQWSGQLEAKDQGSRGGQLTQPGGFDVELELGSLLKDKLVFTKFELADLNVRVDIDSLMGDGKIPAIMDNGKKAGGGEPDKQDESAGKTVQAESRTPVTTTGPGDGNDTGAP